MAAATTTRFVAPIDCAAERRRRAPTPRRAAPPAAGRRRAAPPSRGRRHREFAAARPRHRMRRRACSRRARSRPGRWPRDCTRGWASRCAGSAAAAPRRRGSCSRPTPPARSPSWRRACCWPTAPAPRRGRLIDRFMRAGRRDRRDAAGRVLGAGSAGGGRARRGARPLLRRARRADRPHGAEDGRRRPIPGPGCAAWPRRPDSGWPTAAASSGCRKTPACVLYTLQNYRSEPFTVDTLRLTSTPGAVFILDVPRVADPVRVFDQMKLAAKRLTHDARRGAGRRQPAAADRQRARRDPAAGARPPRGAEGSAPRPGQPARAGAVQRLTRDGARASTGSFVAAASTRRRPAPRRAAQLRARDRASTTTAITCRTRRRSATPSTTRCSASCRRWSASTRRCVTPDSPTQRVGGAPRDASSRRSRTACRCCRSNNAFSDDEVEAFDAASRERPRRRARVEYAAEPKFDGLAISLAYEDGVLRRGRDARRRRHRRGRDREPAHDPRDPAAAARRRRRRGCSRCAAKC